MNSNSPKPIKEATASLIETPIKHAGDFKQLIEEQALIFKALGHPSRLLMIDALRQGPQCVRDLQELIGDDMSTVSKHLSVLKSAKIVTSEKIGTNMFYHLTLWCADAFLQYSAQAITGEVPELKINKKDKKKDKKKNKKSKKKEKTRVNLSGDD